jgi:hypothetical protein
MNAATLLNELHSRNVALFVVAEDRLRFEAKKDLLDDALLSAMREHKHSILAFLGKDGSIADLLNRRCPLCRRAGMRVEETWRDELHYFDTFCANCEELVEVCILRP